MRFFSSLFLCLFFVSYINAQTISLTKSNTYERHTELEWKYTGTTDVAYYKVIKKNKEKVTIGTKNTTEPYYVDFTDSNILDTSYYIVEAINGIGNTIASSDTIYAAEYNMSDDELMDMVQRYTFRYFYDEAHPISGMARERNNSGDVVTTGGTGFGIMAILVGIENGYITRQQGINHIIKVISFLQFADRYHGVFPHWMNGKNGKTIPFSTYDDGGDLVETSFLMEGLLTAKQFFDKDNPSEKAIRDIITNLYEDVEWDFYSRNNSGVLYWHWSPNYAWQMNFPLRGYNEALITYLLAIASPTHAVSPNYWTSGWTKSNYANGNTWFGHKLYVGPAYGGPLFFAHYSFLGFDPRNIKDQYTNYFINNTNHTLINRAYCIYNPLNHSNYNDSSWGLTASDNPTGYLAHQPGTNDNGTIAPTAALSSMPYTPEESMKVLKHFYFVEGEKLFGKNGFYDAFNGDKNWYASSYLAIDQGPIIDMIQNHRTGLLWKNFMKNIEIKPALDAIGFKEDTSPTNETIKNKYSLFPNPVLNVLNIDLHNSDERILLFDQNGQLIQEYNGKNKVAISIDMTAFTTGKYLVMVLGSGDQILTIQEVIKI